MAVCGLDLLYFNNPNSVHDGWGISEVEEGNAIKGGDTETMDQLAKDFSYRTIAAHGLAVGLSDGLMGNSEVGYVIHCNDYTCCRY